MTDLIHVGRVVTAPLLALAEAQAAYEAAWLTAVEAFNAVTGPAREKYDLAIADARLARISDPKAKVPAEALTAWFAACAEASQVWRQILAGPDRDVKAAIAAARGRPVDE